MNHYYNPVHTIQGKGCAGELPKLLDGLYPQGCQVLLLAWDDSVFGLPAIREMEKNPAVHVKHCCFQESNPTVEQLFSLYSQTADFNPQVVLAVGGGSVMDVGKSLCCLYGKRIESPDSLRSIIQEKRYGTPQAKWIGVPTTAGTGSEVTCWATIWDPAKDMKRSVELQENYAYAALADSSLIQGMPMGLAVSSALDAVAHAVESYWARHSNMTSKKLALGAIKTILSHMDSLLAGEESAYDYMSQGSMLAGLAFSNTKTTACHSISYPLTMRCKIPHGTAVSLLLAPVMERNFDAIENREMLLEALGVQGPKELGDKIRGILRKASVPASLKEWGIRREDLKELAALGITKGRADNNPVELTPVQIEEILEDIYEA